MSADSGGTASGGMSLRSARGARHVSHEQLASMAGVSRQALSAVESGKASVRVAVASVGDTSQTHRATNSDLRKAIRSR